MLNLLSLYCNQLNLGWEALEKIELHFYSCLTQHPNLIAFGLCKWAFFKRPKYLLLMIPASTVGSTLSISTSFNLALDNPNYLFNPFRQHKWVHQSKGRKKQSQKWESEGQEVLPTQLQKSFFFWWYRAEAHYEPEFLLYECTQRTTSCQERLVSDTRVSCPPHLSVLIPRSACLQHRFSRLWAAKRPHTFLVRFETGNKQKLNFLWAKTESSTGLPV